MEKFHEIAGEFFIAFEGRHLFPKLISWEWLLWCLSIAIFFSTFFGMLSGSMGQSVWLIALTYGALAITSELLRRRQQEALLKYGNGSHTLGEKKTIWLETRFQKPATEFLNLANDICQLTAQRQQGMLQDINARGLLPLRWSNVLSAANLFAIVGLALATLAAFMRDEEKVPIRDALLPPIVVFGFLGILAFLLIYPLLRYSVLVFLFGLRMWQARFQKGSFSKQVQLEYLRQSLIQLYDPCKPSTKTAPVIQQVVHRETA